MKKSLFFALFACVALAFVSCNPGGEDPNAVTGITVTPAEISLVPGDEARLSVAATPAGATFSADSVVWVSSDTNVVVVNSKGGIKAVGYGKANVTATYGELSAACAVWVKTYYESLSFTNAIVWDMDTTYFGGEVYDIETADGSQTFKCYLAMAELMICSDGFIVNNEGYLDGGTLATYITMYAPMYYGSKYLNPEVGGVQFSLGEWGLAELPADSVKAHIGAPGKVNEEVYLTYMNAALQSLNQGDAQMFQMYMMLAGGYEYQDLPIAISGTTMVTMEYDVDPETNEGGYYSSYIPDGIITTPREFTDELLKYAKNNGHDITITKEGMYPEFILDGVEYSAMRSGRWHTVHCHMLHPELAEPENVTGKKKVILQLIARLIPLILIILIEILLMLSGLITQEVSVIFWILVIIVLVAFWYPYKGKKDY